MTSPRTRVQRTLLTTTLAIVPALPGLPGLPGNRPVQPPLAPAPSFAPTLGAAEPRLPRIRGTHPRALARAIAAMIGAGNRIARRPYTYGGGHGSFTSAGYDCSGSVSYVLHAAGLLSTPEDSSQLETYGRPGPGRHVTIYANAQHALMTIDGRRFDTIAFQETGTRWAPHRGDVSGYTVRHPRGL